MTDFLAAADPEHPRVIRREVVERERQQRWAAGQGLTRRRLFTKLLPEIGRPIDVPAEVSTLMEPLTWFTERVGDGTRVSTTGTLNRALVQALDARYDFGVTGKPPQSEAHVFQVTELRELARRLGLVRRRATTLAATALGKKLAGDPIGMWNRLVERTLELPDFDRCVAETWLGAQVVDGPLGWPDDRAVTARAASEQGWRTRGGDLVDLDDAKGAVNTIAWSFRLLGLFGRERRCALRACGSRELQLQHHHPEDRV